MCQGSQSLGNSRGLSRSWRLRHQPEDKSQKAAVIVTGTYSEVRSLLDSYNNPGYTSDKIMSLVFFRGDVALRIMVDGLTGRVAATNTAAKTFGELCFGTMHSFFGVELLELTVHEHVGSR